MLIGSHLSIAGGMHLAIEAAVRLGLRRAAVREPERACSKTALRVLPGGQAQQLALRVPQAAADQLGQPLHERGRDVVVLQEGGDA